MNSPPSSSSRRNDLPSEFLPIIVPSLQVGGLSCISGLLFGGVAGVLKSNTPILFALASGIQWFTLGSTFWASRTIVLHSWGDKRSRPRDKISASCIAGGIGGGVGGLLRGRKNVVPGMLMFAMFGAVGQTVYNIADARHHTSTISATKPDTMSTWLNSKWSPVRVLSDDEYEAILGEKLLRVNTEIALVDDNLMRLANETNSVSKEVVSSRAT